MNNHAGVVVTLISHMPAMLETADRARRMGRHRDDSPSRIVMNINPRGRYINHG